MFLIIGLFIGFIGYLMISNINLTVIELVHSGNKRALTLFIAFALIFEWIYCFFTLLAMRFIGGYPQVIHAARVGSVVLLFVMGLWAFIERAQEGDQQQRNLIARGWWSVFIHPQQIPFWFFWGIFLSDRKLLTDETSNLLGFSIANIVGSFFVFLCYIKYGNKIVERFKLSRKLLKNIVGVICILSGAFLLTELF